MNRSSFLKIALVAIVVCGFVSCKKDVKVTGVQLDKTTLTLGVGETATLTATILPADATDKDVSWESSNSSVVTVSNGIVNAKTEGTATITVTTNDGKKKATCTVTVSKLQPEQQVIGMWMFEKVEVKDVVCSDPTMTAMLKLIIQQYQGEFQEYLKEYLEEYLVSGIEFTEDGKMLTDGKETGNYKVEGNKLVIEDDRTFDLSFPDNVTMCWIMDLDDEILEGLSEMLREALEELLPIPVDNLQVTKLSLQMTFSRMVMEY